MKVLEKALVIIKNVKWSLNINKLFSILSARAYIGDLDNLLSGIIDELRGRIIDDDAQVMEITAKKNIVDTTEKTRYSILIQ
jgi:Holliday junction resolvase RusA-like endonuclease